MIARALLAGCCVLAAGAAQIGSVSIGAVAGRRAGDVRRAATGEIAGASGPIGMFQTGAGNDPTAVVVRSSHAYVVNYCGPDCYGPLDVVDVADPAHPTLVGDTPVSWGSDAIAVQGPYAYVTGYYADPNYLRIMAIADPARPSSAAAFTRPSKAPLGVAVRGRFAYMLDDAANRLDVIDISNPAASSFSVTENTSHNSLPLTARLRTAAGPSHIALQGTRAYVVNSVADDVQVISIANPARPRLLGTSAPLGPRGRRGLSQSDIAVDGPYAYVANTVTGRLDVLRVAASHPTLVATAAAGIQPDGIALEGPYALLVNRGSDTLDVFDIATPRLPALTATLPTGVAPSSVALSGGDAYVTDFSAHALQILEVRALGSLEPSTPPAARLSPAGH